MDTPKKELCERELGGRISGSGLRGSVQKQGGAGLGSSTGEDATLEGLGKRELCRGIGERGWHCVSCVAGVLCITEIFMKLGWNCAPEGVFNETQLQKLQDGELRGGVC